MTEQEIIEELKARHINRAELAYMLQCTDRQARRFIELLAHKGYPIINQNGYKIATSETDLKDAYATLNKERKRAKAIFHRQQALSKWMSNNTMEYKQLTISF